MSDNYICATYVDRVEDGIKIRHGKKFKPQIKRVICNQVEENEN